ncbi:MULTISPECIES: MotA/TolQ/ExbB proton channel family protein [unclassified Sulfurospirillum]|uniref:MotA/TolQ/ExbB proton channel family protein n=1 Tax=unclassified Sulfurospirillum TaxID=2618290 RepID=UPI0005065631|nr:MULTISPECIES: MotA/TolQ/ExbB proton channel family protein [unclassified Sulfurospirillum]KFL33293.1 flagellar motor protein MotA [Sulfurospirillum sp. SCADC]
MSSAELFLNYFARSGFFTWVILIWLSAYFIITCGIFFSRYFYLGYWLSIEKNSLESMLMGSKNVRDDSILRKCSSTAGASEKLLNVCKNVAEKNATSGLWMLSIIASTAPFIGLFGTVVSILETFSGLGQSGSASLGVIAPAISEALVATATGIFVAIPAYSANLFLRRKAYEVIVYVQREVDILLSANEIRRDNA